MKINLGCGSIKIPGWSGVDMLPGADIVCDISRGIPLPSGSVNYIYSEHFWEHLPHDAGKQCLADSMRLICSGGKIRIAMPDLEYVVKMYLSENWKDQAWLKWEYYARVVTTRAEAINRSFRDWEHQFLYDYETISRDLQVAGFVDIKRCNNSESADPNLQNLETRPDSMLCVEATRP